MSTLTDWLTVIFTGGSSVTPFALYYLQSKNNLPLVEAEAVRGSLSQYKNSIKITLKFTNKIEEKLVINDVKCCHPKGAKIMPIYYKERDDGRVVAVTGINQVASYNVPAAVNKSGHFDNRSGCRDWVEFYVLATAPELERVKISFRISSSARTLKRRRFAIPIKITQEANTLAD